MDGYAVRSGDLDPVRAGTAVTLPVVGDIPAGTASPLSVQPGLCVRIMTGAPLPTGADVVLPVEMTDVGRAVDAHLGNAAVGHLNREHHVGAYIRRLGEDVRAGDTVAVAGS